jgi:hypothetical protein
MSEQTHSLETVNISFQVGESTHVFDLLEMEIFLEEEVDNKKPDEWVPAFQEWFKAHSNVGISYSQAIHCADIVRRAYIDFKKKYDSELKSAFPSIVIPSPSPHESTSSFETTSPG